MTQRGGSATSFNVYLDVEAARWLDSMEGVPMPTTPEPVAPVVAGVQGVQGVQSGKAANAAKAVQRAQSLPSRLHAALHHHFVWFGEMTPGVVLALLLTATGAWAAPRIGQDIMGFDKSPVSPILLTVVLGIVIRQLAGLPRSFEQGLRLCTKVILRVGVALLGLRLSISMIGATSLTALPLIILNIITVLMVVMWAGRCLGVTNRLSALIAVGTSICGVSAITATAPAIKAHQQEVSYAVGIITIFGMLALLVYPFLAHLIFVGNPEAIGLFLGTAIHDTSQVAGAALMYSQQYSSEHAIDIATTTKLLRNVTMGLVIPVVCIMVSRVATAQEPSSQQPWYRWVPGFIVAFLICAMIRSIGDLNAAAPYGILSPEQWAGLLHLAQDIAIGALGQQWLLSESGTDLSHISKLGWPPFAIGLLAAVLVSSISAGYIWLFVL